MIVRRFWLLIWTMLSLLTASVVTADAPERLTTTNHDWRPAGAHLTLVEVARIADATAKKKGISLAQFEAPSYKYYAGRSEWFVVYDVKVPAPGTAFAITIDDRTGQGTYTPSE
jgi:hypothetical protein